MRLRNLESKDAVLMLEWMRDPEIAQNFRFDATNVNMESVQRFIANASSSTESEHFAIADEDDEYLGTISLKNIDMINKHAEYAISLRKSVIGSGIAFESTKKILEYAFLKKELEKVYLNVYSKNLRAIKFYEKFGFIFEGEFRKHVYINGEFENLKWYSIVRSEYEKQSKSNQI